MTSNLAKWARMIHPPLRVRAGFSKSSIWNASPERTFLALASRVKPSSSANCSRASSRLGSSGSGDVRRVSMTVFSSGETEAASSSTVSSPVGALSWGRYPILVPRSHSILPSSDSLSPRRIENKVVLPAPFGPTNPSFSPRIRRREISRKRIFGPKRLLRLERVSMTRQKQTGLRKP